MKKEAGKFTERILERALPKERKDFVVARIYSENMNATLIDYHDEKYTAMQRTTAFPTAIIAEMILNTGLKGVFPPEMAVDPKKFIRELKKKGIKWKIS